MSTEPTSPRIVSQSHELRVALKGLRQSGRIIGFVPTMGALHEGHLSLVRAARSECDVVVVSIYVNPTQFGRGEDFDRYPRDLESDTRYLSQLGVDWVFAPTDGEMYPEGFDTWVQPGKIAERWEGEFRPGHFRGVATVVLKLFCMVGPDRAYFGEKDYQQLLVIRRMTEDFNLPIAIVACPTVREPDGLAMSSRNAYLSPKHREQARVLSQSLFHAAECAASGERSADNLIAAMRKTIAAASDAVIDYAAIVDPNTLEPVSTVTTPVQALLAVRIGGVRLIDNLRLMPPEVSATSPAND
ncbi:pantoate--beta-alanine ligase [Thermopirellula anaerolimosa]